MTDETNTTATAGDGTNSTASQTSASDAGAAAESADLTQPVQTTPTPAPAASVTAKTPAKVTMSVDSGEKHVKMIIDDTAVLAEIGAGMVGQPEIATGIAAIVRLADAALQGAADADVIVINDENIVALLGNVTLDKPTS